MKVDSHKLYGIIGCPVEHSLSPYMHNAAFKYLRINAAYLPFSVRRKKLKAAISALTKAGISGFNVTVPFKTECMRYLDSVEKTAKSIGAVNTVAVQRKKLKGYNTDYLGFLMSLDKDLSFSPRGKCIFVIGAGGAARAVCFGLAKEGASSIYVYDILKNRSRRLIRDIKKTFPRCKFICPAKKGMDKYIESSELIVNTTPLGMKKKDPLPIDTGSLHKGQKLYDVVYKPLRTSLVRKASKKGLRSTGGIGMLLYQGTAAFEIWTGKKAPVSLMKRQLIRNIR
jgi:shikimate dehydrogenase